MGYSPQGCKESDTTEATYQGTVYAIINKNSVFFYSNFSFDVKCICKKHVLRVRSLSFDKYIHLYSPNFCQSIIYQVGPENPVATRADFFLACLGNEPALCSSQVDSSLPIALLLLPVGLQPARGAWLPSVGHLDWGIQSAVQTHLLPWMDIHLCELPLPLCPIPRAWVLI